MINIKDICELKLLSNNKPLHCFVSNGDIKLKKSVVYLPEDNKFWVFSEAEGIDMEFTEEELILDPEMGKALDKGYLFYNKP